MSGHVAPHRWADLWAGRVGAPERKIMERHAQSCRACARVRQRVTRASDSFATIRTQPSPEASWDSIRARVHWSVSTERRAALRRSRPAYGWLAGALAAGVAVALVSGPAPELAPATQPIAQQDHPAPVSAPPPAALVGLVSRASGDVMVDGVRPADLFARALTTGSTPRPSSSRSTARSTSRSRRAPAASASSSMPARRSSRSAARSSASRTTRARRASRAGTAWSP
jgi:hypothetical protein